MQVVVQEFNFSGSSVLATRLIDSVAILHMEAGEHRGRRTCFALSAEVHVSGNFHDVVFYHPAKKRWVQACPLPRRCERSIGSASEGGPPHGSDTGARSEGVYAGASAPARGGGGMGLRLSSMELSGPPNASNGWCGWNASADIAGVNSEGWVFVAGASSACCCVVEPIGANCRTMGAAFAIEDS